MKGRRALLKDVLCDRRLAPDPESALALIDQGKVLVNRFLSTNPNRQISDTDSISVVSNTLASEYVSRGGHKLIGAIEGFGIQVQGKVCIDLGCSTGGFSDCLIQLGASHIYAVDVGYGIFHEKLRELSCVTLLERTNARNLDVSQLALGKIDLVVADLSFISLEKVAANICGTLLKPKGEFLLLVKPQFEASKSESSRTRGVISDPQIWTNSLVKVANAYLSHRGGIIGIMPSPLKGPKGNCEFFIYGNLLEDKSVSGNSSLEKLIAAAVEQAQEMN